MCIRDRAKNGSKVVKTAKKTIKVGTTMTDAKQTAVKKIVAEYSLSLIHIYIKKSERKLEEKIDELMQTAIDTTETIMVDAE